MNELKKAFRGLDRNVRIVSLRIDETSGAAEIEGDDDLKDILFECSAYILKRWHGLKEKRTEVQCEVLDGARWFLPFLPLGGIESLQFTIVVIYWSVVMRIVCSDRGSRLGYANKR